MKIALMLSCAFTALTVSIASAADARALQIYFIDVEGGQSTLLVGPSGESLLIDTGFAGDGTQGSKAAQAPPARDANRIAAAARDAHLRQIDFLLITHFHPDHMGGVPELVKLLPVRTFVDHGGLAPNADRGGPAISAVFNAYVKARRTGGHLEPKAGELLPLKDMAVVTVSTAGAVLREPLTGGGQSIKGCSFSLLDAEDLLENPRSTGVVVQFGKFRFLDVGDLSGQPLHALACPRSIVGPVSVYLVAHHGGRDSADPASFAAFQPRVAVLNNGMKKGGSAELYRLLHQVSGIEGVWQLHRSQAAGASNFPPQQIANLDESSANWIKLTAREDGSFSVVNPRTGETRTYAAH